MRSCPVESTNNKQEQIRKAEEMKTITTPKFDEVGNTNNLFPWPSIEHVIMKRHVFLTHVIAFGLLFMTLLVPVRHAAHAQGNKSKDFVPPVVFQAAAPTAEPIQSIQSIVD